MHKMLFAIIPLLLAFHASAVDMPLDKVLADWPERLRETAKILVEKYGLPQDVTADRLIWMNNGTWKRTVLYKEQIPHNSPQFHTDFLEQAIDFKVPVDKFSALAAFDGSVFAERTKGEIVSVSDSEEFNVLAINLASEVASGTKNVEEARKVQAEMVSRFLNGERVDYTQEWKFVRSTQSTADPDQPAETN